jgi:glycosyltransferase involved in cell wall biosynthesis
MAFRAKISRVMIAILLICSAQSFVIDAKVAKGKKRSNAKPNVILLVSPSPYWGGRETHRLNLYKTFLERGYKAIIVVDPASKMERNLQKESLPCITTEFFNDSPKLYRSLKQVCEKMSADLVICDISNLKVAKLLKKKLSIKILCEIIMHSIGEKTLKSLDGVDGVLISSPFVCEQVKRYVEKHNLDVTYVGRRVPFPSQNKFLTFTTQETKESFFKKNFGISTLGVPVLCMIANMYANALHKNHALFFQAASKLIYEKKKPIEIMLAGDGVRRSILEKMAREMGLGQYVHFLGATDKIPELLHFSDIHVLTSSVEAFGAVYIEAGLMHRPSIGATKTGAVDIIQDGKTGFLFKNGDLNDLVNKIEILLDDPIKNHLFGENAFDFVMQNYSTDALFKKYQKLLSELFGKRA